MSITEELVAKGHSSSGFCQKCWDEAYWRSVFIDPDKTQVDHYYEVMAEAVSGKDVADSQPEPDAANPEGFVRPAVTEAQPWRVWYDNYEKGSAYIGPDVDTIIADDLYYEKAEAICEAHNAALAAVPAPSPAPAAEPSTNRIDQLVQYVYRMREPDVVTPDEERVIRTIAGLIAAEARAAKGKPLPASPSPAVAPLDVGLLTTALHVADPRYGPDGVGHNPMCDDRAEAIAEAYQSELRKRAAYAEASEQEHIVQREIASGARVVTTYGVPSNDMVRIIDAVQHDFEASEQEEEDA